MSRLLFLLVCVLNVTFATAQMDDKFYYPSKELKSIEWTYYEEIEYEVESDTIYALILKPYKKPITTIIYCHGAGGNVTHYIPLTKVLVENGFQVIMPSFRGYGKSTGSPTHLNIASDGQMLFDSLTKMDGVKETQIVIYGASMGSQIATHLAKNNQDKIESLILEGALSSFADIAAFYAPEYKYFLENNFATPYSAKTDIEEIDRIPKLIIHSEEDKDVPFIQGRTLFEIAPEPKKFLVFEGNHLEAIQVETDKVIKRIMKMIN